MERRLLPRLRLVVGEDHLRQHEHGVLHWPALTGNWDGVVVLDG